MKSTHSFDVLVVYSDDLATNASGPDSAAKPFAADAGHADYNRAYAYFLKTCRQSGLKAAFTTSDAIVDAGTCRGYWSYKNGQWLANSDLGFAPQILEKFIASDAAKQKQRQLLFSSTQITPFNDPQLISLCNDKYQTYQRFPAQAIPTALITDHSPKGIDQALAQLHTLIQNHPNAADFNQSVVVKDRYGASGNHVYLVDENNLDQVWQLVQSHPQLDFLLQPLVNYQLGFTHEGQKRAADIRLIYHNQQILQSYVRLADKDEFRCNGDLGAQIIYPEIEQLPPQVIHASDQITRDLKFDNAIYALDFIIADSGHVYLVEGNAGPGINWDKANRQDELAAKELIHAIVAEFVHRQQVSV